MQPDSNVPENPAGATEAVPAAAEKSLKSAILPILPIIKLANATYRRELPDLLKTHYGKWVAYHGDRRLGFGKDKLKLLYEWLNRGIPDEELLVRGVVPDLPYDEENDEYNDEYIA